MEGSNISQMKRRTAKIKADKILVATIPDSDDENMDEFEEKYSALSSDDDWDSKRKESKPLKVSSTQGKRVRKSSVGNDTSSKRARTEEASERKQKMPESSKHKLKEISDDKSNAGTSNFPLQDDPDVLWQEADLLAEREGLDLTVASNLHKLFQEDNTIPFIARYRKELTRNMEPEQLRHAKDTFEDIRLLRRKSLSSLKTVDKLKKLTPLIQKCILSARSFSELEDTMAQFKTGSKKTLAARARELGLEQAAVAILEGSAVVDISSLINSKQEGLRNEEEVKTGIQHIIAEIISKTVEVLDEIQHIRKNANIRLESSQKVKKSNLKATQSNMNAGKKLSAAEKQDIQAKLGETSKFQNYFNFSIGIKYIKPHQVLAINRGKKLEELNVHYDIPEGVLHQITSFCQRHWLSKGFHYPLRPCLLETSIKDSYKRLIEPLIIRQVHADLSRTAERASIEVFALNLKKLLLIPPFRGHTVLGIDPGFRNGCKAAIVSQSGEVLETGVLHIHNRSNSSNARTDTNAQWIRSLLIKHGCAIIALGNGKACRETEEYLSNLIQSGFFKPHLDVSYTIVNEQGASIYSCSEEAKKEFPGMDPNLISAVSLARRLQNPLAELVKIDPKHQGVGMYQHDLSEKKLANTLDEVVVECVSFVGVDLNTASHCLLRRIAGLSASKAEKILEYRKKNGPFTRRSDIKKVKGVGEKSYEQCAGFIRILPETLGQWNVGNICDPLDRTWIHPESYSTAKRLLDQCEVKLEDFGSSQFSQSLDQAVERGGGIAYLAVKLGESDHLVKHIIDGLQHPNYDLRFEFEKPLFRKGLTSIDDIVCGNVVTGVVRNTIDFGAFVDIGVGCNGLIHKSAMGRLIPQLGDKVQVKIVSKEIARRRIGLQLLNIL